GPCYAVLASPVSSPVGSEWYYQSPVAQLALVTGVAWGE
ncbi:hypothetical protein A2U01_0082956, partial [Trifolium medium]|nr:hypothetical protein [Trifolium medium]